MTRPWTPFVHAVSWPLLDGSSMGRRRATSMKHPGPCDIKQLDQATFGGQIGASLVAIRGSGCN